jgi:hypothetical protein
VCAYRRTPVACDVDRQAWKAGLLSFTDHERPKSPRGPAVFIVRSGRSVDAPSVLPEGFRYHHGLITADEEEALAGELAALPFKPFDFHDYQASRQVVGFGLRYDYDRRAVVEAAPGEPCGQAQRPPADKAGYLKRDAPSAANPPDSGRGGNRPPDRAEIKKLVGLNPVAGMPPTLSRHCSLRLQQGRRAMGQGASTTIPQARGAPPSEIPLSRGYAKVLLAAEMSREIWRCPLTRRLEPLARPLRVERRLGEGSKERASSRAAARRTQRKRRRQRETSARRLRRWPRPIVLAR